jgi:hypothetical protein
MDLCCARISDEINDLLGFYPQEMTHRSLYTFITSENNDSLSKIHRHLLDNVVYTAQKVDPHYRYIHNPPTEQSTSEKFFEQNPQVLCSIANGSQSFTSVLYFKNSNGNVEPLQSQFCLGGGLGADLLYPSTLGSLYIICLLSKAHDAPLSAPSPSGMSTGSLSEHQPLPVPLVPANQWDLPYPESPSPLSSQSIQPQPQHPTQLVQSQSQNQQEQQKQPQLPQRYANSSSQHPLHQAPQQQTQPQQPSQGGYGFMNSSIQFMEHRGSMQEDTESYALHPSQRGSVPPYADRSMVSYAPLHQSGQLRTDVGLIDQFGHQGRIVSTQLPYQQQQPFPKKY